jgi:hypothetical protein
MITLKVPDFCENCPEFEANVEKETLRTEDIMTGETIFVTDTLITCKHECRYMTIKRFLDKCKNSVTKAERLENERIPMTHEQMLDRPWDENKKEWKKYKE